MKDFRDLGLSEKWDETLKLVSGTGKDDQMRRQAMMITNSAYFEMSILGSVVVAMVVLAMQSEASPPMGDHGLTLRILEIFVTIYLSAEMALEFLTAMTAMRQLQWLKSPWTWIEIFVLAVSWLYLLDPMNKFVKVCRVMRILRPIRSLRLFHSVEVIATCFGDNLRSFMDVVVLTMFVLFLTALIGVHLFNGAIQATCLPSEYSLENVTQDANGTDIVEWAGGVAPGMWAEADTWPYDTAHVPAGNITVQTGCPHTLQCYKERFAETPPICALFEDFAGTHVFRDVDGDDSGYRGFDHIGMGILTMFIHMSGDGGMGPLPNTIDSDATLNHWVVWSYFGAWSETSIRDTSCCDHPLNVCLMFAPRTTQASPLCSSGGCA